MISCLLPHDLYLQLIRKEMKGKGTDILNLHPYSLNLYTELQVWTLWGRRLTLLQSEMFGWLQISGKEEALIKTPHRKHRGKKNKHGNERRKKGAARVAHDLSSPASPADIYSHSTCLQWGNLVPGSCHFSDYYKPRGQIEVKLCCRTP